MSLREGAVVAITSGVRFIGQRLDPRSFLLQMMTPPKVLSHDLDLLEVRRVDTFSGMDEYEGDMRGHTDQIRKAIEGEEGDGDDK
jgi:hypothetical protein